MIAPSCDEMRVLHVIPYMHPRAGGPPVVVEQLVREIAKYGHTSEIISTPLYCDADYGGYLQLLNQIAPTSFLTSYSRLTPLSAKDREIVYRGIANADIVHVHTLWSRINVAVRTVCVREGKPYVIMPHGMLDPYSLSVKGLRKQIYFRLVERRNLVDARRVIYTTDEEARLAEARFTPMRRVVIPLGGDAPGERAAPLAKAFWERYARTRGRRQILFLGRLHYKKGLDRVLAVLPSVVRAIPNALLTIVGEGEDSFVQEVRRYISDKGLEEYVLMTGRLDGEEKWQAYASADVFVLPSRQENFAISVAEAMHMGIPVIVSRKVNTWPIVQEAGAGVVVDETNIEGQLESAMCWLLSDYDRIKKMGSAGRNFATRELTWKTAAKRFLQCYQEVVREVASDIVDRRATINDLSI
jgi:glycosyltransferase involved in cell wall biosynthesis